SVEGPKERGECQGCEATDGGAARHRGHAEQHGGDDFWAVDSRREIAPLAVRIAEQSTVFSDCCVTTLQGHVSHAIRGPVTFFTRPRVKSAKDRALRPTSCDTPDGSYCNFASSDWWICRRSRSPSLPPPWRHRELPCEIR